MKQLIFLCTIIVFGCLSFIRPVYDINEFYTYFNNFENCKDNCGAISAEQSFSGNSSCKMYANQMCSYIYEGSFAQLSSSEVNKIEVSSRINCSSKPKGLFVVCQFQHANCMSFISIVRPVFASTNKWKYCTEYFIFDRKFEKSDRFKIYYMKKTTQETVYIDDMQIKFY